MDLNSTPYVLLKLGTAFFPMFSFAVFILNVEPGLELFVLCKDQIGAGCSTASALESDSVNSSGNKMDFCVK